ncbi:hypothetical protein FJQ87_02685 [Shewanella sp. SNU WT4]|uniref:heavy metal-binding domain-containing protein n=1 Tax=Shewanella sp. SNU WT4 TaxID=2590015 RepID=UPI00112975C2|nr:heavy metal-binding domain-containing protein [Shewanella sp. SNU WT4]QDF65722.1 hypothetical protein FJQ87_02685 [Shewanella sp. SNU WT4]
MLSFAKTILLTFFFAVSMPTAFAADHSHAAHAASHSCPMHPEVTGVKGDSCPKCGMDLTQTSASGKSHCPSKKADGDKCPSAKQAHHGQHAQHTPYDCPMHPEVTGVKGDSCPKCGMDLEPVATAATHDCPMHPEVTGVKGDSCPKCGMDLEAKQTSASKKTHHHG